MALYFSRNIPLLIFQLKFVIIFYIKLYRYKETMRFWLCFFYISKEVHVNESFREMLSQVSCCLLPRIRDFSVMMGMFIYTCVRWYRIIHVRNFFYISFWAPFFQIVCQSVPWCISLCSHPKEEHIVAALSVLPSIRLSVSPSNSCPEINLILFQGFQRKTMFTRQFLLLL
jgi:hypothetical protein